MEGVQERAFRSGEADAWFRRNRTALAPERAAGDPVAQILALAELAPRRVLEVGCSNGWRLQALAEQHGCVAIGVEPSREALTDGRTRHPRLDLREGLADALPLADDERVDLVLACFVLHWLSRDRLLRAVAEIDRVLADGGCLAIADFLPDAPSRVPYHHLPGQGVSTFKQDYAALFRASGLYAEVARLTFDHADRRCRADIPGTHRCVAVLLRKSLDGYYLAQELR